MTGVSDGGKFSVNSNPQIYEFATNCGIYEIVELIDLCIGLVGLSTWFYG